MARSRSLPTDLCEQPAFFELDSDTQMMLVGFALAADDYGRGVAHRRLLARKLDKDEALIEQALTTLQAHDFLCCYQVGRGRYYALTCWQEWQSLHKPTPSKYPAPPPPDSDSVLPGGFHSSADAQDDSGVPRISPGVPGFSGEIRPEEEEEEPEGEKEERRRNEVEDEAFPGKVVTSLAPSSSVSSDDVSLTQGAISQKTRQVAQILHLPLSGALRRVVADYGSDESLSLLGEADAAREWIEDRHRNRKGQAMTPAFFRRWLGREQANIQARQRAHHQDHTSRTPTTSLASTTRRSAMSTPPEDPYAAFIERRVQEVKATAAARRAAAEQEAIVV
ncbi:MAG: hypothetical protein J2P37_15380 [Ktedonobacteraceae bacterium]|nr:hypothetical protein [Ktedonobacteraceae bacterium]